MINDELATTIEKLSAAGKGILAADESTRTIGQRFDTIGVDNNATNRLAYRELLCSTEALSDFISGVILFEETLEQVIDEITPFPELLQNRNLLVGIKVDRGLITLPNSEQEKVTQGLDGLRERLIGYKNRGACFAKWRNVYQIGESLPTLTAVKAGAENLARYAAECQALGIVPIVEPEVLMAGEHDIEQCAEVTEIVLHELFNALFIHQVTLENIVLKPSMVIDGADAAEQSTPDQVAEYTLSVFRNNVPAAVPTINFLSGGQTPEQATENLNAINQFEKQPWQLSFSYGRALQAPALEIWKGNADNKAEAQNALYHRAKLNAAASLGEYSPR